MNIKKKAIKGAIWSVIQNWGSQAGSFIVFVILARLLTPEDFGIVSLANVFLAFFNIFLEQGFTSALVQREELEAEHLDTGFWAQVISGILLFIFSLIIADEIAAIFQQPQLTPILQCLSCLFLINSFGQIPQAILQRNLAFKIMAVRSLIAIITSGIVGIYLAFSGLGVWSLVGQQVTFESVMVLVMWKGIDWRPKLRFSLKHFQDLFSFSIYVFLFRFIKFFERRSDNLLIGYFLGEVALGYYAIAYRILEVMIQLLIGTTNQVALPVFSRLQTEPESFRKAFYQVTQFTSLIAFPAFLGMLVLAPEVIVTLFGKEWLPSVSVMRILTLMGILSSLSFFNLSVFVAMGKPEWRLWLSCLNATISFFAALWVIESGIVAVALAFVISVYLVFPLSLWMLAKLIAISLPNYLKQFVTPLISSLVMVACISLIRYFWSDWLNPPLLLGICTAIALISYPLAIRLTNPQLFQSLLNMFALATSKQS
ncbi:lipopolysaccharide biosynthesis protein [Gloeocapsa sp. PCC 73106]|uniref:lipopolysaccharide biosynthesis protein n=1 Tax=Gloeocapsa sp. PCC 73106 TaxID=102232 RepID=UPI0002ACC9DD|nr:lipopolysaccharide biosynthesis protein [Gloeocapsa sp. PCC 73106]ELR97381.1 membrane protein involved in the export of O-antigen and teichoic acid [Gloeocapsa sp. PCC 73106]